MNVIQHHLYFQFIVCKNIINLWGALPRAGRTILDMTNDRNWTAPNAPRERKALTLTAGVQGLDQGPLVGSRCNVPVGAQTVKSAEALGV